MADLGSDAKVGKVLFDEFNGLRFTKASSSLIPDYLQVPVKLPAQLMLQTDMLKYLVNEQDHLSFFDSKPATSSQTNGYFLL